MNNTYTWTITSMSTLPSPPAPINEYVVLAQYLVTGTDGTYTASIQGSRQFTIDTTATPIPYSQLTQAQVLGWIQEEPNLVTNTQACIDGQIASIVNPPVSPAVTELPWVTALNAQTFTPAN